MILVERISQYDFRFNHCNYYITMPFWISFHLISFHYIQLKKGKDAPSKELHTRIEIMTCLHVLFSNLSSGADTCIKVITMIVETGSDLIFAFVWSCDYAYLILKQEKYIFVVLSSLPISVFVWVIMPLSYIDFQSVSIRFRFN